MLYGSLLRQSSLLRYLPGYFDFIDDSVQEKQELSPKAQKRQETEAKFSQFTSLLKPQNEINSDDEDSGNIQVSTQGTSNAQQSQKMDPNMLAGIDLPTNNFTKRAQKRAAQQNLQESLSDKK